MKTFFKPESFGKNIDVVQFKTKSNIVEDGSTNEKQTTSKKSPKNKNIQKKLASNENNKIQAGRIEKTKNKKKKILSKPKIDSDADAPSAIPKPKQIKEAQTKVLNNVKSAESLSKVQTGRVEKKTQKNNKRKKQKANLKAALKKAEESDSNEIVRKPTSELNELAQQLKEKLMGGRFRYINEQLYTMDSKSAEKLFLEEPEAFAAYHDGYRHQVEKWPLNPLDRIIKMLRRLPKTHEIGDFGCGEGRLAKSVPNKVYSMDLVACRDDIIACDMAHTPLKAQSLDVAVYCLSLMGTNLHDYLLEANRVLKIGGLLLIAEIQSRFDADLRPFLRTLDAAGFELIKRDESSKIFYFFRLKKTRDVGKVARLPPISLKPCVYKKR